MADFDARAEKQIAEDRGNTRYLAQEQHQAELAAAANFFAAKADGSKDEDDFLFWYQAATVAREGGFPVHRRISSDPEITKWQNLLHRCAYAGTLEVIEDE